MSLGLCADLAWGMGGVAVELLAKYFPRIDLIDPVEKFVLKAESDLTSAGVVVRKFLCGAQEWIIEDRYDCFWVQWAQMSLTDDDCVAFLRQCGEHLNESGIVVVKDNTVLSNERRHALWCPHERSISRTLPHQHDLFTRAGFRVDFEGAQSGWPSVDFVPLYCFVLKPE
jgi:hypothetical protein